MCPHQGSNLQPFHVPDDVPANGATQPGLYTQFFFNFHLLIWETDRHSLVVPLIYTFTGSFLYVPWPRMEPTISWCTGRQSNKLDHLARAQHFFFFLNPYLRTCLLIFRERGKEKGERERNIMWCLSHVRGDQNTSQACSLTRNQTHNLSVYRRTLQSTEPTGQGMKRPFFLNITESGFPIPSYSAVHVRN